MEDNRVVVSDTHIKPEMSPDLLVIKINEQRKQKIMDILKRYPTLADFRKENKNDYGWVISNNLKNELFQIYPDFLKREKYKKERKTSKDPKSIYHNQKEKAFEKAILCGDMKEYKIRFLSRYLFCQKNNLLGKIEILFKNGEKKES